MRYIYLLLVFGICECSADASVTWMGNRKHDDIDNHVERPCPHNEINCIRRYFAQHSYCKVAHGPMPDPFYMERSTLAIANANITYTMTDVKVSNLNGKITEFTINKKTKNLVIAAEMKDIRIYSPKVILKYHRKNKEPIVLSDELIATYESITFTAIIPNIDKLEFTQTEVFSYIENGNVPYAIGPGVIKTNDMDVIRSFNKMVSNVPEGVKEAMVFQGPVFMLNFIQYNICNFGLKIIST